MWGWTTALLASMNLKVSRRRASWFCSINYPPFKPLLSYQHGRFLMIFGVFFKGSPKLPQNRSQYTLKIDHVALLTLRWLRPRCLFASRFCCQTDCLAVCPALARLISSCQSSSPNPTNMPRLYAAPATKYGITTKSALPGHFKVHQVLHLPRNMHLQITSRSTRCCTCYEICTSRSTKYCTCHEICTSRSTKYRDPSTDPILDPPDFSDPLSKNMRPSFSY